MKAEEDGLEVVYTERSARRKKPRRFLLKWNHAHSDTNPREKFVWSECWGTLYPNGRVSLDVGGPYDSLTEMREHVSQAGLHLVQWLDSEKGV